MNGHHEDSSSASRPTSTGAARAKYTTPIVVAWASSLLCMMHVLALLLPMLLMHNIDSKADILRPVPTNEEMLMLRKYAATQGTDDMIVRMLEKQLRYSDANTNAIINLTHMQYRNVRIQFAIALLASGVFAYLGFRLASLRRYAT